MSRQQNIHIEQNGVRLGVEFNRINDRWHHKVVVVAGEVSETLMESVEGDADEIWPPSPALQEVDLHELDAGPAILAVGMSGTSHWSGSYSVEQLDDGSSAIKFDLAGRLKQQPVVEATDGLAVLGSCYLVNRGCVVEITDSEFEIELESGHVRFSVVAQDSTHVNWQELEGKCLVQLAPTNVSLQTPQTVRWAFNLQFRQS